MTVTARVVTGTDVLETGGLSSEGIQGETVEQLFADVKSRLNGGCKVTVSYDEAIGYPLRVWSDCGQEGDGWTVSDFVPDS